MDFMFQGKYLVSGKIVCKTGLHIGGIQEGIEIGGVDNIVIRDSLTDLPYIPGSSLKGKLRYLLEWALGKVQKHPKHGEYTAHFCGECDACIVFGPATDDSDKKEKAGPSRLTVRDAYPTGWEDAKNPPEHSSLWKWRQYLGEGIYTELKSENTLNRVTSEAMPRTMERVPAGSEFTFEMIFDIYRDEDRKLLKSVFTAMQLLEDSALGGSGTRGYGKIEFEIERQEFRSLAYYKDGTTSSSEQDQIIKATGGAKSVREIIARFPKLVATVV